MKLLILISLLLLGLSAGRAGFGESLRVLIRGLMFVALIAFVIFLISENSDSIQQTISLFHDRIAELFES